VERAITINVNNMHMLGILHLPNACLDTGVVLIVGGPQYRVGSHRQFVQLARALARKHIACLRFDYRGMGDSEGVKRSFETAEDDIRAACDAFVAETGVSKLVLWGLCDAASAAMMYAPSDPRVAGMVLLNPWLRSEAAMGKAMVQHYYLRRIFSRSFWRKVLTGQVRVGGSLRDLEKYVRASRGEDKHPRASYQARMETGLNTFCGRTCLVLSGADLTAREFEEQALKEQKWPSFASDDALVCRIPHADHTFSSANHKSEVEAITIQFVERLSVEEPLR
jgi:exosortase A-associated hydrolase 1